MFLPQKYVCELMDGLINQMRSGDSFTIYYVHENTRVYGLNML